MRHFLIVMIIIIVLVGCESFPPGKIKLGGSYGEVGGFIEYEISPPKSAENKVPTLVSKEGKELYVLDEKQAQALLEKIEGGESAKISVKEVGKAIKKLARYME